MERLKKIAQDCFTADKSINYVTVVSDGNAFTNSSRAAQHAKDIGAVYKTFTRSSVEETAAVNTTTRSSVEETATVNTDEKQSKTEDGEKKPAINLNELPYQDLKKIASQLNLKTKNQQKATLLTAIQQYYNDQLNK